MGQALTGSASAFPVKVAMKDKQVLVCRPPAIKRCFSIFRKNFRYPKKIGVLRAKDKANKNNKIKYHVGTNYYFRPFSGFQNDDFCFLHPGDSGTMRPFFDIRRPVRSNPR